MFHALIKPVWKKKSFKNFKMKLNLYVRETRALNSSSLFPASFFFFFWQIHLQRGLDYWVESEVGRISTIWVQNEWEKQSRTVKPKFKVVSVTTYRILWRYVLIKVEIKESRLIRVKLVHRIAVGLLKIEILKTDEYYTYKHYMNNKFQSFFGLEVSWKK